MLYLLLINLLLLRGALWHPLGAHEATDRGVKNVSELSHCNAMGDELKHFYNQFNDCLTQYIVCRTYLPLTWTYQIHFGRSSPAIVCKKIVVVIAITH